MGGNMVQAFSAVEENIPTLVVAAHFQKDPQILMAHPGQGIDTFQDLKKSNDILISKEGVATFYQWMKSRVRLQGGAGEALHLQPGALHRQQEGRAAGLRHVRAARGREGGRLQAECLPARRQRLHHLRDDGRDPPRDWWRSSPDVVQRFVDASTIGWYNYLYGDNKAANALIKKDNPEMTRRADRLLDRQDEGIRHRRFRRRARSSASAP